MIGATIKVTLFFLHYMLIRLHIFAAIFLGIKVGEVDGWSGMGWGGVMRRDVLRVFRLIELLWTWFVFTGCA